MTRDISAVLLGALAGLAAVVALAAATALEMRHEEIEQISRCGNDDPAYRGAGDCLVAISPA